MDSDPTDLGISCPICANLFPQNEIEQHVHKCIFFNCKDDEQQKRKRTLSPAFPNSGTVSKLSSSQKSPRDEPSTSTKAATSDSNLAPMFRGNGQARSSSPLNELIDLIEAEEEIHSDYVTKVSKKPYDLTFKVPLAVQVRPKTLDSFFGQNHILGEGTVLRSLLEKGDIPNMILWGPPGCGKTSLSHVIQEYCKRNSKKWKFVTLCAATCGIKEVQNIITLAKNDWKFGKRTVLFMDEIHRFNKKQQDVFLMSVEKGDIILIGATTENPSFSINGALLSRCRVVVLEKLTSEELHNIMENAAEFLEIDIIDDDNPAGTFLDNNAGLAIEKSALKWMADISDGDARTALNNLELVLQYFDKNSNITIKVKDVQDKLKRAHLLYDKAGEEHYNIISAMHKSIRGSDPNAALYWTTRMILSGEDPRYIARRMVRAASEDIGSTEVYKSRWFAYEALAFLNDRNQPRKRSNTVIDENDKEAHEEEILIGNADPHALPLAIATMQGCQLIGMPEADVLLAQCAIYLARAPKSREADTALSRAKDLINHHKGPQPVVPMHIRNAPTTLMKNLGYGQLQDGAEFTFMPPEYKDVDFFK